MLKSRIVFLVLAAAASVHAQGINRVGAPIAGGPVQPAATPQLAAQAPSQAAQQQALMPPAIATPGAMPTPGAPLPGGPLPAPINLKQEALDRTAPLTADEVLQLRQELKKRGEAMQQPLEPVAKPVRRAITLDLSPSAAPEVIRMASNQGTVLAFVDAAGRPWPVQLADNYNQSGFEIALFGPNAVSLGVKSAGARVANIAILLEGMATPVLFTVNTGQKEVDYSVEVNVPRYLPGAPPPVGAVEQIRSLGAADLMNYLLNTPPRDARRLQSDAPNVTAWQISPERMIVRTDALLASPAWSRRQSSTSGVTVYDLAITPRLIVASQGNMMNVRLSGFSGTKEQR